MTPVGSVPGFGLPWYLIEPSTDVVYLGSAAARAAFRKEAERVGLAELKKTILLGIGADGRPLAPIHPWTRQDRDRNVNSVTGRRPYSPQGRASSANAPLTATGQRARAVVLLRCEAVDAGLWWYWLDDPHSGINWGVAMARHGHGFVQKFYRGRGRVPARNILGVPPVALANIARIMTSWWDRRRGGFARGLGIAPPPRPLAPSLTRAHAATLLPTPSIEELRRQQEATYQRVQQSSGGQGLLSGVLGALLAPLTNFRVTWKL